MKTIQNYWMDATVNGSKGQVLSVGRMGLGGGWNFVFDKLLVADVVDGSKSDRILTRLHSLTIGNKPQRFVDRLSVGEPITGKFDLWGTSLEVTFSVEFIEDCRWICSIPGMAVLGIP